MTAAGYETIEEKSDLNIKYFFVSKGERDIIKAIDYTAVGYLHHQQVFNLGFGDYDIDTDTINDSAISGNGDAYQVFNTVLNTIPKFFDVYKNAAIMVSGSDSGEDFVKNCKPTCTKKCVGDICKNQNRRINAYRSYVNKEFDDLNKQYNFYGGMKNANGKIEIETYVVDKKYDSVFVVRNNL